MVAAIPVNKKKLTDVKIGERRSRILMWISPLETLSGSQRGYHCYYNGCVNVKKKSVAEVFWSGSLHALQLLPFSQRSSNTSGHANIIEVWRVPRASLTMMFFAWHPWILSYPTWELTPKKRWIKHPIKKYINIFIFNGLVILLLCEHNRNYLTIPYCLKFKFLSFFICYYKQCFNENSIMHRSWHTYLIISLNMMILQLPMCITMLPSGRFVPTYSQ